MVRLLVFIGLALCFSWPGKKVSFVSKTKKIFIGVDGVSREQFDHAQKLGLFSQLKFVKTHIAPFPSISDYSWNVMVQARNVHGHKGRIGTYEAAHFDRERNELVTDAREYFRRLGEDHHYFSGAFEHWLNPYVESLLYIPTEELPKLELKQLLSSVKEDRRDLVTVMVASSDALAHTRADGSKFLVELDKFITAIDEHFKSQKTPYEIILASDHGQAARFTPEETAVPLKPVKLADHLKKSGLRLVKNLEGQNDVVIPVMALANYGTAYFKTQSLRGKFLDEIRKENWFSLGLYRTEMSPERMQVKIVDGSGEALLTIEKKNGYSYFYQKLTGNPLEIPEIHFSKWITDDQARKASKNSAFPDALYRIAFSAYEEEAAFPDLLFTMKDDFYLAGDLDSFTSMYQTHGSLGRRSSSGILASTHALNGGDEIRTVEILPAAGITPHELFKSTEREVLEAEKGKIATGSEQWDNRRVFQLMNRAVQESRYVFNEKSFDVIMNVVKPLLNQKTPQVNNVKWKEALTLTDVAHMVDLLIKNGNVDKVKTDPRFQKIQARLAEVRGPSVRAPSSEDKDWLTLDLVNKADAAKKIAMKSYSSMFLMEKALTLPEIPFIDDPRKERGDVETPAEMFAEIFKERSIVEEIFPTKPGLTWSPESTPKNVTLVYVPGIYNSLFDDEIFRSGLDQLKNKWGVRVIAPEVFSTCSSSVNGELIMNALVKDHAQEIALGRGEPSYFILGYSKGGVDSLHAMTKNTDFISKHVLGLMTVASPIKGSSILNKVDLPLPVMILFGAEKAPAICEGKERASTSVTPAGAQSFLRKNTPVLAGLTRFYSMSFVSDLKSSHLFMRATKNIARFGEPNDGVVALSASRFPDAFGATDLGIVNADHLSGIVASHFPHKAFLESILFTLVKDGAFSPEKKHEEMEKVLASAKNISPDRHRAHFAEHAEKLIHDLFDGKVTTDSFEHRITKALGKSLYALAPFSVEKKDGELFVNYRSGRWPSFNGGSRVKVSTPAEMSDLFLSSLQLSKKNFLKNSRPVIPESTRTPSAPPSNELGYSDEMRLNLRNLEAFISGKSVTPVTRSSHPEGFSFVYDHASSMEFRSEFQLSFEDCAPADADDHAVSGWETIVKDNKVWGKLASENSSIRLTTYSWRFLAGEYPELDLELQVNDDVEGADVLFGGSGKDDSAFQLWFTFRVLDPSKKREYLSADEKMMTIGYYFGDEIAGANLEVNQIYKNYFSEKDFVVARLPAASQKLIGIGKDMMGRPILSKHNIADDIRKAYPDVDPEKAEIVAITIQHDSNDTKGKSEALFRSLSLRPKAD